MPTFIIERNVPAAWKLTKTESPVSRRRGGAGHRGVRASRVFKHAQADLKVGLRDRDVRRYATGTRIGTRCRRSSAPTA